MWDRKVPMHEPVGGWTIAERDVLNRVERAVAQIRWAIEVVKDSEGKRQLQEYLDGIEPLTKAMLLPPGEAQP